MFDVYLHLCVLIYCVRLKRAPSSNKPTGSDHQELQCSGNTVFKPGCTHHLVEGLHLEQDPRSAGCVWEPFFLLSLIPSVPLLNVSCLDALCPCARSRPQIYSFKRLLIEIVFFFLGNAVRFVSVRCHPNRLLSDKIVSNCKRQAFSCRCQPLFFDLSRKRPGSWKFCRKMQLVHTWGMDSTLGSCRELRIRGSLNQPTSRCVAKANTLHLAAF